jgi:hypothetical protein
MTEWGIKGVQTFPAASLTIGIEGPEWARRYQSLVLVRRLLRLSPTGIEFGQSAMIQSSKYRVVLRVYRQTFLPYHQSIAPRWTHQAAKSTPQPLGVRVTGTTSETKLQRAWQEPRLVQRLQILREGGTVKETLTLWNLLQ